MPSKATRRNEWRYLSSEPRTISGDGTISNPFDASTSEKFYKVMNALPVNSKIHLIAGTYTTYGVENNSNRNENFYVKSGWYIRGDGRGKTIIQMDWNINDEVDKLYSVFQENSNTQIGDITYKDFSIDLNFQDVQEELRVSSAGVNTNGFNQKAINLEVKNIGGYGALECFGIQLLSPYNFQTPSNYWTGNSNIIEDCLIHSVYYPTSAKPLSPIYMYSIGGQGNINGFTWLRNPIVRRCIADGRSGNFGNSLPYDAPVTAYKMEATVNGIFEQNVARSCKISGPISKSFPSESLELRHNLFANFETGVLFKQGDNQSLPANFDSTGNYLYIHDNVFYVGQKNTNGNNYAISITPNRDDVVSSFISVRNTLIKDNVILWESGFDPYDIAITKGLLFFSNLSGLVLENNYADCPGNYSNPGFCWIENSTNFYLKGNNFTFRNDGSGIGIPQSTGRLQFFEN